MRIGINKKLWYAGYNINPSFPDNRQKQFNYKYIALYFIYYPGPKQRLKSVFGIWLKKEINPRNYKFVLYKLDPSLANRYIRPQICTLMATSGSAIGTAGKEESILEERAVTMNTILCLIKAS